MSRHPGIHRMRTAYWVDSHLGDYFISPSSPPSELSEQDYRPSTPSDNGSSHSDPPQMILRHVPGPHDAITGRHTSAKSYGRHERPEPSTSRPRRHSTRSALSQPEQIRILPANHPIRQEQHAPPQRSRSTTKHVVDSSYAKASSFREQGGARHPVHTTARPPYNTHQVSHSYSHPSAFPQTHMTPANPRDHRSYSKRSPQIPTPATKYGHYPSGNHRPPDHGYHASRTQQAQAELGPTPILYTQSAPLPYQYRQHGTQNGPRSSVDANDRYRSNRRRTLSSQTRAEDYLDRSAHARQMHKRTYTSDNIPQSLGSHGFPNGVTQPITPPVIPSLHKMSLFQRIKIKLSSGSDSSKRSDRPSKLSRRHSTDGAPSRSGYKGRRG